MTASLCMNCPYDCDYCYLKGMYPSGHLCLFVNLEDLEAEIRARLLTAPLYLSVSYDTDLCALEPIHGYVRAMHRLCSLLPDLVCEVRTKCACTALLRELPPLPNFILAMTLSPHEVIRISEHRTPSLKARLEAVRTGLDRGHSIRLCLDPLLFTPDWQRQQQLLVKTMLRILGPERLRKVRDFSVGSFRISQAYLPALRKCCRTSPLVQYPFRNVRGYYQYPPSLALAMEASMTALLRPFADEEKIFRWEADP